MTAQELARRVGEMLQHNSPAILTALGVSGVAATGYFAHKAGQQAFFAIREVEDGRQEVISNKEKVELTWRYYIPPVLVGLTTCVAVVGAQTINSRRQAALFSAVSISERALNEYREKAREIVGEKKEGAIREAVAAERIKNDPQDESKLVILGTSEILCYDMLSGRYFKSNIETLRQAMNDVNAECINNMYASLNMFWSKIGLPPLPIGESLGWNTDTMLDLVFSYIPDEEGRPTCAVDFRSQPKIDYYSVWN